MSIVIQKYGGSSVATPEKIKAVAQRIGKTKDLGHHVVVVVSAMGNTTDELLSLAKAVSPTPQRRELDMLLTVGERISMAVLSMALQDLGYHAVSFTGSQSGIITTNDHTNARIIRVTPYRIQDALSQDAIVIVAGFQGVSEHKEITSLGRGGSDTTAVALAAALNATYAEICSDVDGVYSTDPRLVPSARHIDALSYDEMQSLSDAGAKVLHAEAVEWARRQNIEIRCASTHADGEKFTKIAEIDGTPKVSAITKNVHVWCLSKAGCAAETEAFDLVSFLGDWGVDGVRSMATENEWSLVFSTKNVHSADALRAALTTRGVSVITTDHALVTVVGRSLTSNGGALSQIHETLNAHGITRKGVVIEPNGIGFLVSHEDSDHALAALHDALIVNDAHS